MAFVDYGFAVRGDCLCAVEQLAFVRAQAHCRALVDDVLLLVHNRDDGIERVVVKFRAVRAVEPENVAGVFDDRNLHAETYSEIGNLVFARIFCRQNLALNAPVAEAPGDEDAVDAIEVRRRAVLLDTFGIDAQNLYLAVVADARVCERFVNRLVRVLKVYVFAHDRDFAFAAFRGYESADNRIPRRHIAFGRVDTELFDNELVHTLLRKHKGQLVNGVLNVHLFDDRLLLNVAEHRELLAHIVGHRLFGAAYEDVGLNADFAQLCNALLRWLRLQFARRAQIRKKRYVYENHVVLAHFERELAQCFEERKTLDVADRSPDFGNENIDALARGIHTRLDFVGDVRDDLNGLAQIVAAAFLLEDVLVNLPRGEVVEAAELAVRETLVVPEVEVGFRAVVENVNFAVLERTHRSGVYIEIGVEFLDSDLQISCFQKSSERARSKPFTQR